MKRQWVSGLCLLALLFSEAYAVTPRACPRMAALSADGFDTVETRQANDGRLVYRLIKYRDNYRTPHVWTFGMVLTGAVTNEKAALTAAKRIIPHMMFTGGVKPISQAVWVCSTDVQHANGVNYVAMVMTPPR